MNKVAIVIGATGLVGRSLVQQLAASDTITQVITLTRRADNLANSKVVNHVIDFGRMDDYKDLFQGEYLFSCLGSTLKQAKSIKKQRIVDLEYQYQAAKLAAENGVKHYLLISSSGADAQSKVPYLQMKGLLEKQVSQLPFEKISIFQPSILKGQRPEPRPAEIIGNWIMAIICLIPGLQKYSPIKAELLAKKMLQVSQEQQTALQFFTLQEAFPR